MVPTLDQSSRLRSPSPQASVTMERHGSQAPKTNSYPALMNTFRNKLVRNSLDKLMERLTPNTDLMRLSFSEIKEQIGAHATVVKRLDKLRASVVGDASIRVPESWNDPQLPHWWAEGLCNQHTILAMIDVIEDLIMRKDQASTITDAEVLALFRAMEELRQRYDELHHQACNVDNGEPFRPDARPSTKTYEEFQALPPIEQFKELGAIVTALQEKQTTISLLLTRLKAGQRDIGAWLNADAGHNAELHDLRDENAALKAELTHMKLINNTDTPPKHTYKEASGNNNNKHVANDQDYNTTDQIQCEQDDGESSYETASLGVQEDECSDDEDFSRPEPPLSLQPVTSSCRGLTSNPAQVSVAPAQRVFTGMVERGGYDSETGLRLSHNRTAAAKSALRRAVSCGPAQRHAEQLQRGTAVTTTNRSFAQHAARAARHRTTAPASSMPTRSSHNVKLESSSTSHPEKDVLPDVRAGNPARNIANPNPRMQDTRPSPVQHESNSASLFPKSSEDPVSTGHFGLSELCKASSHAKLLECLTLTLLDQGMRTFAQGFSDGSAAYMVKPDGGIVDDFVIENFAPGSYMVVT